LILLDIVNACIWLLGIEHKLLNGIAVEGKNVKARKPKPASEPTTKPITSSMPLTNSPLLPAHLHITGYLFVPAAGLKNWTIAQVHDWLVKQNEYKDYADKFKAEDVDGFTLSVLTPKDLNILNVKSTDQDKLLAAIKALNLN
jgi:SAM domain (Sterile alpha motif)